MPTTERLLVVVADADVGAFPYEGEEPMHAVPCTYHSTVDLTVYLWHWLTIDTLCRPPCLVHPLAIGQSITIYYPKKFYFRATVSFDFRSAGIAESIVGHMPRHVVLMSKSRRTLPQLSTSPLAACTPTLALSN